MPCPYCVYYLIRFLKINRTNVNLSCLSCTCSVSVPDESLNSRRTIPMPFTAAPHHDVLVLVIQVAVLLFTARALGELAQRLGQPSVVGEILAGIVLGPSLLSGFVPFIKEWLVPQTKVQGYLLEVVSL